MSKSKEAQARQAAERMKNYEQCSVPGCSGYVFVQDINGKRYRFCTNDDCSNSLIKRRDEVYVVRQFVSFAEMSIPTGDR